MPMLIMLGFLTMIFGLLPQATEITKEVTCPDGVPVPWCASNPCHNSEIPNSDICRPFLCGGCYAVCFNNTLQKYVACGSYIAPQWLLEKAQP
uniref:WAP domain-containing protein n=1 Tax=Octopus bimaculoides TaxID=37653 RepID=A0A0L8GWF3_OCTBM